MRKGWSIGGMVVATGLLMAGAVQAQAPAPAAPPGGAVEQMIYRVPDGFALVHSDSTPEGSILEFAPNGETALTWTELVTIQSFPDWAGSPVPDFLQAIAVYMQEVCPSAAITPSERVPRVPYEAALRSYDCPFVAESGQPESFIIMAIAGTDQLHAAQYAWRRVPGPADLQRAYSFLNTVRVCDLRRSDAPCPP